MKRKWAVLLLAITFSVSSRLTFAQDGGGCAGSIVYEQIPCTVGACSGNVTVGTPQGQGGFSNWEYAVVYNSCCGQGAYPYYYFDGSQCYWTKLDDPTIRQNLIELAKVQPVLIRSCGGRYHPLEAVLAKDVPWKPTRPEKSLTQVYLGSGL